MFSPIFHRHTQNLSLFSLEIDCTGKERKNQDQAAKNAKGREEIPRAGVDW